MTGLRLLWHLVLAPAAGAAGGAALYGMVVRPLLTWPSWVLDVLGVICGTGGLVLGAALSFLPTAPIETDPVQRSTAGGWLPLGLAGSSTVAVAAAVLLAGVPGVTWPVILAGGACGVIVYLAAGRWMRR